MKLWNSRRAGQMGQLTKYMMIGTAAAAFMGLSMNAQAQPACTVDNWDDHGMVVGLSDADTGYQGANNRRYGGPCGLRVAFDGEDRYLINDSPNNEDHYIARFYAFLDDLGPDPVIIFAGEGNGDDHFQVIFNEPDARDLTLRIFDESGVSSDLLYTDLDSGWHSIEVVWETGADAEIRFALNSDDPAQDLVTTVNNSGLGIDSVWLGNVAGASVGGTADFDDFDSRRNTRPERLCRGLTDETRDSLSITDAQAIFTEVSTAGSVLASGQPDFNETGSVTIQDAQSVFTQVSTAQNSCEINS